MLRKPSPTADIRQMSLMHSETILNVTRAFLRARVPSEFAEVTTEPIQSLETLATPFDSDYPTSLRAVDIHNLALDLEKDRATVDAKATFRDSNPRTGADWSHLSIGVVHLRRERAGWRVFDFVDNRRSQLSGVFLEPFGGHEFQGIEITPLAAELSHLGTLVVFQVVNRTTQPLELVFARLHYKSCRVLATVPERSHVAPPGVTTRSLAIFPIALPVEAAKFRFECGMLGSRNKVAYNIAFDIGLNSAELGAATARRWRGRRTNLPFAARLGIGAAALATFFGSLTFLPDAAAPPLLPEASRKVPAGATAVSDMFVDALLDQDTAGALELLDSHTPGRRGLVTSITRSLGEKPNATLDPPRGKFYSVGGANRLPSADLTYGLTGNPCPAGQPRSLGQLDINLHQANGRWRPYWATHHVDRTPCS
jgi:hypothetical protein